MTNVAFESIDDYNDIETVNMYWELVREKGMSPQVALALLHAKSRDNARTPMQWDDSLQAGFTSGTPWIKVNPNCREINVRQALADPDSIFYYYQKLIRLRKEHPVMVYGEYNLILEDHPQIYAFTRTLEGDCLLVMLNFSRETPLFRLPDEISLGSFPDVDGAQPSSHPGRKTFYDKELLISNYEVDPAADIRQVILRPYEARLYRLR